MTVDAELSAGPPGIDVPRLADWLRQELPEAGRISAVELIAGGRSNLTYRIDLAAGGGSDDGRTGRADGRAGPHRTTDRNLGDHGGAVRSVVLRRPPLGHVLPTAHDMGREHRVLSALSARGAVPVPRPLAFCADEGVIGAPFYLMEYVEGRVLRTVEDAVDVSPAQAGELSERLAEALAAIHLLDIEDAGLSDFGRPAGYLARQLTRWGQQWERSKTRESPECEQLAERLGARLPADGISGLVHGDFRLDNALTRLTPRTEIAAIVDWEMSTLGDPLSDLGLTLVYWADAGDEERLRIPVGSTVTSAPGFLTRRQFTDRYAELTGFDLTDLDFYVAFASYKLAVILEGIHARFLQKATVGDGFEEIGDSVPVLVERAHRVLDARSPW
ncbi:phosphotransferase family protein [Actinomadura sp. HBU206391]|uniref:phosphotransferase family protein n=1 Tax=Actinomadura sp. HBU206391 TaxID=2731692 RepID=UPI00164F2808|nr:phosphotransferase family protein [Actinomadura sp. HBU206391]MBC6460389.1 phosphotransferase family protein [Actinomadura sp. HBU206391]